MDALKDGSHLLSKGMRGGNAAITFIGAVLVARGIFRWLEGPKETMVYSRRLKPGERVTISLAKPEV